MLEIGVVLQLQAQILRTHVRDQFLIQLLAQTLEHLLEIDAVPVVQLEEQLMAHVD